MATRRQLAEQVIRILKGYKPTDDRNIDIREVALAIDQRRDAALREAMFNSLNIGEGWVEGEWLTEYTITAKYNEKDDKHELKLKYKVFSIPSGRGLWYLGDTSGELAYIPLANGYASLLAGSRAFSIISATAPTYYLTGQNVRISGLPECEDCEVLVRQLGVSGSFDLDDEYAIPTGYEFNIIADVLKLYGVMIAPDEINNDLDGK